MELLALVVDSLRLEEDNGVGALKRCGHESLCVVRRGREYYLESRDVSGQSRPILRMLCAVLASDGYAEDDRHLEDARAHCLPLSHLVEYLVARTADKVGIHQLDDNSAAAHCVADDRGLGDGRVEEAVIGDRIGYLLVYAERAAPVAVILTVCDERRVVIELVDYRLTETVADVVDLHLRNGLAVCILCGANLGSHLLQTVAFLSRLGHLRGAGRIHRVNLLIREHDGGDSVGGLVKIHARRDVVVYSELDDLGHTVDYRAVDSTYLTLGCDLALDELFLECGDRICSLPCLDLLRCTVCRAIGR